MQGQGQQNNFETVYKNMVLEIFVQNPHPVAIMKRELEVDKIIFQLGEETLKEF